MAVLVTLEAAALDFIAKVERGEPPSGRRWVEGGWMTMAADHHPVRPHANPSVSPTSRLSRLIRQPPTDQAHRHGLAELVDRRRGGPCWAHDLDHGEGACRQRPYRPQSRLEAAETGLQTRPAEWTLDDSVNALVDAVPIRTPVQSNQDTS